MAVNRPGSGRFIMISRDMRSKGEEGEQEKRARRDDFVLLVPLLAVGFRKLALSAFVLFRSVFFSTDFFPPPQPLFLQPHLLAGVISDLTDTLDERCSESVKQVVIKTDAISL